MSTQMHPRYPGRLLEVRSLFGIDSELRVPAFDEADEYVPEIDPAYRFNPDVTLALLAGFMHDRRVLVQGLHGTGKSSHIEQVAARLNWPCMRVNLDGHIGRLDLVGRDAVVVRDGRQITEFQEGIVPWALQRPMALIFAGTGRQVHAARPEPCAASASGVPAVRYRQHAGAGQYQRPVSRCAAAEPCADRPVEHRGDAELSAGG